MKANELRIGNYVNIGLKSSELRTDFDKITASGLLDLAANKEKSSFVYEPIPLTEQWLLDFGFKSGFSTDPQNVDASKVFNISNFEIHQPNENKQEFIDFMNNKLINVHQLQNLYFALTNKELTINEN